MMQKLLPNHQTIVDRFVEICQTDGRIVAAFLGGSYATAAADAHSDLDLYLITTDAAYEEFLAEREAFVRGLGEPLFLEDWGTPYCSFCIFADGTECELWIGQERRFTHIHGGAYTVPYWAVKRSSAIFAKRLGSKMGEELTDLAHAVPTSAQREPGPRSSPGRGRRLRCSSRNNERCWQRRCCPGG